MKKDLKVYRLILRILGSIAFIAYILFLIDEGIQQSGDLSFEHSTVYILFLVFLAGYIFLWKNEIISGILLIAFYVLQWCLVIWVWENGGMTVILGFPIAVLGILVLIYGIKHRS